jgi:small-conductance mechanosensitive channel
MNARRSVVPLVFLVLLIATAVGLVLTSRPISEQGSGYSRRNNPLYRTITAAQDQFETARTLAANAVAREEKWFAREALRIADSEVDLAFATALREASENPPKLSPEAQAISKRLAALQAQVDSGHAEIERLKKLLAGAEAGATDELQRRLQLAQAQADLDQDEVDAAHHELVRAGGDPQGSIARSKQRYETQQQAGGGLQNLVPQDSAKETQPENVVALAGSWQALREKMGRLKEAQAAVQKQLGALKQASTELPESESAAPAPPPPSAGAAARHPGPAPRKSLAVIDRRIDDETQLADTYGRWSTFLRERQRQVVHGLLYSVLWVLIIALLTALCGLWLSRSLAKVSADQRQAHTLHSVAGYAVRGVGLILILFVVFGPPSQFAAVLALAGAGLTVVLKDFLIAFIGWFILMGRHGIRVGDWVEINGVSGEVVEIGPLRTILLEMGNLSEAGQPTGRKIAFMNGFAVEGNYLNFSTSGQWMWDEVQFTVPPGDDPIAAAEALKQLVTTHNKDNARLAAEEWRRVAPRAGPHAFGGEPVVSVRPTGAGVTLTVRYITRARDRNEDRSRLYRAVLDQQRKDSAPGAELESDPL